MVILSWFVSWLSAAFTMVGVALAITGLVGIGLAVAGYVRGLRPAYLVGRSIGACLFTMVVGAAMASVAFWGGKLLRQPDPVSNAIWLISLAGHGWQSWRFASRRLLPTIMRGTHGVHLPADAVPPGQS